MKHSDMKKIVGIVGATGAVGIELTTVLHQRNFPLEEIVLFASERSVGKVLDTAFGLLTVRLFTVEAAQEMDIVFLAVSGNFAKKYAKDIASKGTVVIDNSSAFRLDDDVPLVIPEINGEKSLNRTLIANPNCTTAIAAMPLWPLLCKYGIKRIIVSTYQAASGAGAEGMEELYAGTRAVLDGKKVENKVFPHPLPFNVIPHIDTFQDNLYTREEMKVTWETRKIFEEPNLSISCTAVRIPIVRAHSEAITIETIKPVDLVDIRNLMDSASGVSLVDEPEKNKYPMPLEASSKEDVFVGRIRKNIIFDDYGLDFFVCGDQLLRGAALNAVLIAEYICNPLPKQFTKKIGVIDVAKKNIYKMLNHNIALKVGGLGLIITFLSRSLWR